MPGHHHRSSSLRQSNKKNKRSKSSKRSLSRSAGGKINRTAPNSQRSAFAQSKVDRRNKLQQKRDAKREALLRKKRGVAGGPVPPRVVGIISLGSDEHIEVKLRSAILEVADNTARTLTGNAEATTTTKFDVHKKDGNLTILTNSTAFRSQYSNANDAGDIDAAVQSALDLCRICDMVVFVIDGHGKNIDDILNINIQIGGEDTSTKTSKSHSGQNWDHLISERGDRVLNAVKGQGMPSILTVLAHTEQEDPGADFMSVKSAKSTRRAQTKRAINLKKYVSRFAITEFGADNDNVIEVDISYLNEKENADLMSATDTQTEKRLDIASLVRALCTKAASPPKWISEAPRPYILADSQEYDPSTQELKVTGYVRGKVPFSVNSLVHIPNLGTVACKTIEMKGNLPLSRVGSISMDAPPGTVLASDPSRQESLEMFATPDALEGEQNLVGFDDGDIEDAEDEDQANAFSRPAGWSDYQSAWLDAVDDVGTEDEGGVDHGELANELNKKSSSSASLAAHDMDIDDVNDLSPEERRLLKEQRKKEQSENQEFPDEVEVDEDLQARDRFARYRSLKSFKKTYWDPKENLPDSYGTVFHFANFKATQRSVMQDMKDLADEAAALDGKFGISEGKSNNQEKDIAMDETSDDEDLLQDCVPCGSYVTVTFDRVTPEAAQSLSLESLITAVGLLPHENKVSVLHAGLSHSTGCNLDQELPVKSKDLLTFRCGWRTWQARPVFSQNNLNCNKHKFERFMPTQGAFFASTFFGPVTYTPCPVLVFREQKGKPKELCAVGSMIGADADRIVVKRIILTGYPVRVHKRHATVKYMFYNPEDVKWFKPAGLWTKHGLNGNIMSPIGEHGVMKCLFNAPIKQHDTVCLPLYKRIFPKFVTGTDGESSEGARSVKTVGKPLLVVR